MSVLRKSALLLLMIALATIAAIPSSWKDGVLIPNVTAVVGTIGVGVYWNPDATNSCQSIYWGQLSPGSKKSIVVYLKNEGKEPIFYLLSTERWYPVNASSYMTLQSDCDGTRRASSGSVRQVSLTLLVSPRIYGIVDFSFEIVVKGSPNLWGDVNGDGTVDIFDMIIVIRSYGSTPNSPNWNPNADLNGDLIIDLFDEIILARHYGETAR